MTWAACLQGLSQSPRTSGTVLPRRPGPTYPDALLAPARPARDGYGTAAWRHRWTSAPAVPPPGWWPHGDARSGDCPLPAGSHRRPGGPHRRGRRAGGLKGGPCRSTTWCPDANTHPGREGTTVRHPGSRQASSPNPPRRSNREGGERRPSPAAAVRTFCRKPDGAWRGGELDVVCCDARWKGRPARLRRFGTGRSKQPPALLTHHPQRRPGVARRRRSRRTPPIRFRWPWH